MKPDELIIKATSWLNFFSGIHSPLCCLVAIVLWLLQAAPSAAAINASEAGKSVLPGETPCRYQLPSHRKWAKQEIWAWTERICLGGIADMQWYGGGDRHSCDPKKADDWPKTRDLSSEFLETILNHEPYRSALTRAGVRIQCARFNNPLNLSNIDISYPLWLDASRFRKNLDLRGLRSSSLISLQGSVFDGQVDAEGLDLAGNFFARNGARFNKVVFHVAKIGGVLDMSGSTFYGPLEAQGLKVVSNIVISNGARFNGPVNADRIDVSGHLLMRNSHFNVVRLRGSKIGGNIETDGSTFNGLFNAEGLEVAGGLLMRNGASFNDVSLIAAKVGIHLQLHGGNFNGHLNLTSVEIGDEFELNSPRGGASSEQRNKNFPAPRWAKGSRLTLRNAQVGALNDTENAWDIPPGQLDLIGFTFNRLGGLNATKSSIMSARSDEWLLKWLAKQDGFETTHNSQPFEQLAKVLRDSGYAEKADTILVAALDHQRDNPATPRLTKLTLWIHGGLIGYGYRNWIAFFWFAGLTILGTWACGNSELKGPMKGSQKFWYSFDMALPLIDLNKQHDAVKNTGWVQVYFYIHKLVGFIFVSFLVAGLSGLTK